MAYQPINLGANQNDNSGDQPRIAGQKINENFTELYTKVVNTKLANTFFAGPSSGSPAEPIFRAIASADIPSGSITAAKLAAEVAALLTPSGSVTAFAGSTAPTNWLLCDGSAVSRTTYADLFAITGTTYGAGDGSTTFNLPDLRGRTIVGVDGAAARLDALDALGDVGGAQKHTLTVDEMPAHTHTYQNTNTPGALYNAGPQVHGAIVTNSNTSSVGGNAAHNNMQPYQILNYIIKT